MNQAHTDINLVPGQAPHRELTVAIGAVTRSKREGSRYREAMQNHPGPNPPWQNHGRTVPNAMAEPPKSVFASNQ
jgi:hypothetical protein